MKDAAAKGMFAIFAGVFTIFCAASDFDWFMNNHKARFFVNILGRNGARVFYGILGLIMILLGAFLAF
ncbi:MAG: immunity 17 family protein [Candidatus Riflebacteria bacterium]|nr:immunity 17 family protein [Candidatus Riflebacteria bacterium]